MLEASCHLTCKLLAGYTVMLGCRFTCPSPFLGDKDEVAAAVAAAMVPPPESVDAAIDRLHATHAAAAQAAKQKAEHVQPAYCSLHKAAQRIHDTLVLVVGACNQAIAAPLGTWGEGTGC